MFKTKKKNVTRKQNLKGIKRIRIIELGDQFLKFDGKNDIFTIEIEKCGSEDFHGERCKIRWLKLPKKCSKKYFIDILSNYDYMSKNKHYNYWFLGDVDYKVIFLD